MLQACDRRRFLRSRCSPRRSPSCRRPSSRALPSRPPCSSACTTTPCCSRAARCIPTIRGRATPRCRAVAGSRATPRCWRPRCARRGRSSASIRSRTGGCWARSARTSGAAGAISGVRIAVFVAALDERPQLELSRRARGRLLGAARRRSCRSRRASPSCPTATCRPTRSSCPDGDRLVVWGITYAILERLRALPG